MEAVRDADRLCGSRHPERRAIYPCNRIRENETDNGLEAAAIIPRSRCPHRGGLRWLATRTQSRLCGGLLEEFLMCSARKSRAVAFSQRSFGASWKPFECAQRIANRLRARVEIGNRLRTDQPGMPLSISALVGNFFTNINSR
jgi:hypothetical protein